MGNGMRQARAIALIGAIAMMATQTCAQGRPGGHASGPTEVGVMTLKTQDVPYIVTLPGRAVAFEQTDIRPRVNGQIKSIDYEAGHRVKTGDPLFHIDDDTYQAALTAAQAEQASSDANVQAAQAQVDRYTKLEKKPRFPLVNSKAHRSRWRRPKPPRCKPRPICKLPSLIWIAR